VVTKDLSMHTLIHTVLSSDKFEQIVRNGEKGYYDKQEKVFVPTKFVGNLIKEIIDGPAVILGSNDPDSRYALKDLLLPQCSIFKLSLFKHRVM